MKDFEKKNEIVKLPLKQSVAQATNVATFGVWRFQGRIRIRDQQRQRGYVTFF